MYAFKIFHSINDILVEGLIIDILAFRVDGLRKLADNGRHPACCTSFLFVSR